MSRPVEVRGVNDDGSLLGLYSIKNIKEPECVLFWGDQEHVSFKYINSYMIHEDTVLKPLSQEIVQIIY